MGSLVYQASNFLIHFTQCSHLLTLGLGTPGVSGSQNFKALQKVKILESQFVFTAKLSFVYAGIRETHTDVLEDLKASKINQGKVREGKY